MRACEQARGALILWRKGEEGGRLAVAPVRCGSWRCRRCGWGVQRDLYKRLEEGVRARPEWAYFVLTFDPANREGGPWAAYEDAGRLWDKRLRKALERRYGRLEYVQTWEATRRGWPHANVLLTGLGLREVLERLPRERRWSDRAGHGHGRWSWWTAWRRELRPLVVGAGFGRVLWCELVGDLAREGLAAYLAKVCHDLSAANLKAGDQTPIGAPTHFRRVRASRGLLPPPFRYRKIETVNEQTGELDYALRRRQEGTEGEWTGILAPRDFAEYRDRELTWSGDWTEAIEYDRRRREKRERRRREKA